MTNVVPGTKGFVRVDLPTRFWAKVDRPQIDFSEDCWVWTGNTNARGYGRFWVDGKLRPAHRIAWELLRGEIPEGLEACHVCDNPTCVRPSHMFLGTHKENMQDAVAKDRGVGYCNFELLCRRMPGHDGLHSHEIAAKVRGEADTAAGNQGVGGFPGHTVVRGEAE